MITELPLKDIIIKDQPRKNFDAEKLRTLKKGVEKHGIKNPLLVADMPEGYVLVDGERRYRVATELGLKKVPVIVEKYKDDLERSIIQFHVQETNEAWSPLEKAQSLIEIAEKTGATLNQVCEMVGVTSESVRKQYSAFAELASRANYLKNEVPLTFAGKFKSLTSQVSAIYQHELEQPFTRTDEKNLQNNLIKLVKNGEIKRDLDFTKIKDSLKKSPKLAEKLILSSEEPMTPDEMFQKTKAKGAYHLRNVMNNAMYMRSHTQAFLRNPDVELTPSQFLILKDTRKSIDQILQLEH